MHSQSDASDLSPDILTRSSSSLEGIFKEEGLQAEGFWIVGDDAFHFEIAAVCTLKKRKTMVAPMDGDTL